MTCKVPESPCWSCGKKNDMASSAEGDASIPKAGDISICFGCGAWMIYDDDIKTREMTVDEIAELDPDIRSQLRKMENVIVARKK